MQKRLLLREAGLGPCKNLPSSATEAHERSISCCSNIAHCPPYTSPCVGHFGLIFFLLMKAPAAPSASSFLLIHLKENFVLGGNTLPSGRDTLPPGDLLPSAVRLHRQHSRLQEANKNKRKKPSTRSQQLRNNTGTTLASSVFSKEGASSPVPPPAPFPAPPQDKNGKI